MTTDRLPIVRPVRPPTDTDAAVQGECPQDCGVDYGADTIEELADLLADHLMGEHGASTDEGYHFSLALIGEDEVVAFQVSETVRMRNELTPDLHR